MFRSTRTPYEPGSDWLLNNQFDTGASATLRMIGGTLSDAPWVEGHETKWKHQEAYNILWTYEELSAFADDHNACYRAWLGKVAEERGVLDIVKAALMQNMSWGEGDGPEYERPSLLLLHDAFLKQNNMACSRGWLDVVDSEAFAERCPITALHNVSLL